MTAINMGTALSALTGSTPTSGWAMFTPWRGVKRAVRVEGAEVVIPAPIRVPLSADGPNLVEVMPNPGTWCWHVDVGVDGESAALTRDVSVLHADEVVDFGDDEYIVDVDPFTFLPSETGRAAWEAVAGQATQAAAQAAEAAEAAAVERAAAGTAAFNAGASAAAAQSSEGAAVAARSDAVAASSDAIAAQGAAELAKQAAEDAAASVQPGEPGGVAQLDPDGKVPETQVPNYLQPDELSNTIAGAVVTAIADDETVVQAAASAVMDATADLDILSSAIQDDLADDERGIKVDGDDYWGVKWNADGLLSNFGPGTRVVELADDQGYGYAVIGSNGRLVTDGVDIAGNVVAVPRETTLVPVVLNGDSMVGNWGANGATLSAALGGRVLTFRGNGGKQSPWIAGRQGGRPLRLTVSGNELPAAGSVTGTLAFPPLQSSISAGLDMATGTYAGIVEGREVSLQITNADGTCTVTLTDAVGRATPCPAGAPFKTGLDTRDHWAVIWAGRNNFYQSGDEQQIVNDIRAMLEWTNRPNRALVLSIVPQVGEALGSETNSRRLQRNARLALEFPDQYEDVASRLRSIDLLEAVGLTPTATDVTNIAEGYTPESFRSDTLHLNAKGYEALALLIGEIYTQRGWQ